MSSIYDKYEPVIGLEIHAQMKTESKAFCRCSTQFNSPANSNVCPVCLGHPGTLPVLNQKLVEFILKMGLATNCKIRERSIFARKNYFYPDLSKGYQITQFETPICYDGFLDIEIKDKEKKRIGITRIHMEEDAGKSIHDFHEDDSLVDFNRCGVPLIEIVSEPDMRSTDEAFRYLNKVKQILLYLDINDGNMEEGSLRCDANISVMPKGSTKFGTRTEIKNLNSFKNVTDAIEAEIRRQVDLIESGGKVFYNTMTYNAKDRTTFATRTKEEAHDYRYFPEPDLVYVHVTEEWKNSIKEALPEFPDAKKERFISKLGLPEYDAEVLTHQKEISEYYENVLLSFKEKKDTNYKLASNWVMGEVMRVLNDEKIHINEFKITPPKLAKLLDYVSGGQVNNNSAKEVFAIMAEDASADPEGVIKSKNLIQVTDTSEIENIIKGILEKNADEVTRYKAGEKKLLGFLVGVIMRESKGKANPKLVNELLLKNLEEA